MARSESAFGRAVLAKPWAVFGLTLSGHLLGVLLVGLLFAFDVGNVFPNQFSGFPYDIRGDDLNLADRDRAFAAMTADAGNDMFEKMLPVQAERAIAGEPVELIYRSDVNCLTPSNLQSIKALEEEAFALPGYQTTLCQLDGASCRPPRSILRFFDGTFASRDPIFAADPTFVRINEIIGRAFDLVASPDIRSILSYHVGADYVAVDRRTKICRTMFFTGLPLRGFRSIASSPAAQKSQSGQAQVDTFRDFLTERNRVGDMDLFFHSRAIFTDEEDSARRTTFLLMIGSLAFVALFMGVHTLSPWVTFFGLVGIFASLCWTHLLYVVLFGFQYYSLTQVLAAYIATAIGVLAITLFYDGFQDALARDGAEAGNAALRRTMQSHGRTLAILHLGVAVLFFLHCTTNIRVVMAAGLYCGTFCLVHAMSCAVFLPAVVAAKLAAFPPKPRKEPGDRRHPVASFLSGRFLKHTVANSDVRWIVVALLVTLLLIFAIVAGVTLKRDRQQPTVFRDAGNAGVYVGMQDSDFAQNERDDAVRVFAVWGLEGLHRDDCARSFEPDCLGNVAYDTGFDLSSRTAQNDLLDLCTRMKAFSLSDPRVQPLHIRPSISGNDLEISCFIFEQAANTTLPSTEATFQALLTGNAAYSPTAYAATSFNAPTSIDTYYRHYEAELIDWLTNGLQGTANPNIELFFDKLGGVADPAAVLGANQQLALAGAFGSFLRYAMIEVNLTVDASDLSADEGLPILAAWDEFLREESLSTVTPQPLSKPFQTTPVRNTWAWLRLQDELVEAIFQGYGLAVLAALVIASVALKDVALGVVVAVVSAAIPALLFGLMAMIGDNLGLNEALNSYFWVPLSFAHLVVMGQAFSTALGKDAGEKLANAVAASGLPVLSGLTMVFGPSLFLLGSNLAYVFQFGVFLMSWSLFAMVYVFLLFTFLLLFFGHGGNGKSLAGFQRRSSTVAPTSAPLPSLRAPPAGATKGDDSAIPGPDPAEEEEGPQQRPRREQQPMARTPVMRQARPVIVESSSSEEEDDDGPSGHVRLPINLPKHNALVV